MPMVGNARIPGPALLLAGAAIAVLALVALMPHASAQGIISSGDLMLGVQPTGELTVPGGPPSDNCKTPPVSLRFQPGGVVTGQEAMDCDLEGEGWGVSVNGGASAWWASSGIAAGTSSTPPPTPNGFSVSTTTASSSVQMGQLLMTQLYQPHSGFSNVYDDVITLTNTGATDLTSVLYRREMAWGSSGVDDDYTFNTIGTFPANTAPPAAVVRTSIVDRAVTLDPRTLYPSLTEGPPQGPSVSRYGPNDVAMVWQFDFGTLKAGATQTYTLYYGAASTAAAALTTLQNLQVQIYDIAESHVSGFKTSWFMAFGNLPVPPQPPGACSLVTGRGLDGNLVPAFGSANMPNAMYTATYVNGAVQFNNAGFWIVQHPPGVFDGPLERGFHVVDAGGTQIHDLPGDSTWATWTTQAAAEGATPGASDSFIWPGGVMSISLHDNPYNDNVEGTPVSTWNICGPFPINHPPALSASVNAIAGCTGYRFTGDASASADQDGDPIFYSWSLSDGATSVTPVFVHDWDPATALVGQPHSATITITDGKHTPFSQTLPFTFSTPTGCCPVLTVLPDFEIHEGGLIAFELHATNPRGLPLTFSITPLPAGATFDTSTGLFVWRTGTGTMGSYDFVINVTDGVCPLPISINIVGPNQNPFAVHILAPLPVPVDTDEDGIPDERDNCPNIPNNQQTDSNHDGLGDACDPVTIAAGPPPGSSASPTAAAQDADQDGIANIQDDCVSVANHNQADLDMDGIGDACDPDLDGDGITNVADNCVQSYNPSQADLDANGIGDACEAGMTSRLGANGAARPGTILQSSASAGPSSFWQTPLAAGLGMACLGVLVAALFVGGWAFWRLRPRK